MLNFFDRINFLHTKFLLEKVRLSHGGYRLWKWSWRTEFRPWIWLYTFRVWERLELICYLPLLVNCNTDRFLYPRNINKSRRKALDLNQPCSAKRLTLFHILLVIEGLGKYILHLINDLVSHLVCDGGIE